MKKPAGLTYQLSAKAGSVVSSSEGSSLLEALHNLGMNGPATLVYLTITRDGKTWAMRRPFTPVRFRRLFRSEVHLALLEKQFEKFAK